MRSYLTYIAIIFALVEEITLSAAQDIDTNIGEPDIRATDIRRPSSDHEEEKQAEGREILPVREYVSQQFLRALQGRGMNEWVLALERALAATVATTQSTLWRNDFVENLSRQREQIRRRIDAVPNDQVPSILAAMQKRSKNAWNGRIDDATGERLPSFADLVTDTWTDAIKETLNLPIMGPFNPALWKPEEVAELLGPLLNMIPHETAKLIEHKQLADLEMGEQAEAAGSGNTWLDFLNFLSTDESDSSSEKMTGASQEATAAPKNTLEADVPGFGHLVMNDEWQSYKINPAILDLPILGPLNPAQQLAANLPPIYLPYRTQRLRDHAPEWLHLDGLNALMPVNAYTPKDDGVVRERRGLPIHGLLRSVTKPAAQLRRLEDEAPSKTWTQTITESKIFRSILHYLPRFSEKEVKVSEALPEVASAVENANRGLASVQQGLGFEADHHDGGEQDLLLEGKRYYHTVIDAADSLPFDDVVSTGVAI